MAHLKKRVPENVPGDFFVDSTCIDCDACRQIAPAIFGEAAETSFVKAQPGSSTHRRQALRALLACPTGSIGWPAVTKGSCCPTARLSRGCPRSTRRPTRTPNESGFTQRR
jgi:ferredoxin